MMSNHTFLLFFLCLIPLLRAGITGPPIPGQWTYPVAETIRVRALLSQPGPGPGMLYSNWVTVDVQP